MDVPQHRRYVPITLIKRKISGTLCSLGFRQAGVPMGDTESEPDFLQSIKISDIFAYPEEYVPMGPELFSAVSAGKEEWLEKVTSYDKPMSCLKSYQGDSVLHVAAASGHLEIVKKIVSECPCLLLEPNSRDQLPLHEAARACHLAVEALVSTLTFVSATKSEEEREILNLYVVKDKNGNTHLHLALKGSHETIVHCLLDADKQALFLANKDGKSPLYLAVEAGFVSLVNAMLNKVKIFPN